MRLSAKEEGVAILFLSLSEGGVASLFSAGEGGMASQYQYKEVWPLCQ